MKCIAGFGSVERGSRVGAMNDEMRLLQLQTYKIGGE